MMIYSLKFSGSAACFPQTVEGCCFFNGCRIFLLSDRLFPPQRRYGVEESQQASLMQSTFPICSCKFPLFPNWLVILYCQPLCPVLPCIFIILCFSSTTRFSSSSSSLSLFLSLLFWVVSFNFMPPALAVGPLASASLALWHTASSGATILPNTQTSMLLSPGLCIGIHVELMAIKWSRKLLSTTYKDTCCQRRD